MCYCLACPQFCVYPVDDDDGKNSSNTDICTLHKCSSHNWLWGAGNHLVAALLDRLREKLSFQMTLAGVTSKGSFMWPGSLFQVKQSFAICTGKPRTHAYENLCLFVWYWHHDHGHEDSTINIVIDYYYYYYYHRAAAQGVALAPVLPGVRWWMKKGWACAVVFPSVLTGAITVFPVPGSVPWSYFLLHWAAVVQVECCCVAERNIPNARICWTATAVVVECSCLSWTSLTCVMLIAPVSLNCTCSRYCVWWLHLCVFHTVAILSINQATGFASQHFWCLYQARINLERCGRNGIRRKNGGWWRGSHWLVQMEWRPAGLSVCLPLLSSLAP